MTGRMAIVLAAGKGTRMKSDLPKVLHPVCSRPMIHFVLDSIAQCGVDHTVVVVGHRADDVRSELANRPQVDYAVQDEQLGTGHAVKICKPFLESHEGAVLVVAGDSPLIQVDSIAALMKTYDEAQPACILGTTQKTDPSGLGRIVRDGEGRFAKIVEEKEATEAEKQITEVNMSTYLFDCQRLLFSLERLTNDNSKGEYYITDCPGILKQNGEDVRAMNVLQPCESLSINTLEELAIVDAEMRKMGYKDASDA